jgi:exopolysaccharide biosynthesis operon protein EpsL
MNIGKKPLSAVFDWTVLSVVITTFGVGYAELSFAATGDIAVQEVDSVVPYVADQETYDNNLYRLPSYLTDVATLVSPNASREDYINTVYAGVDAQWSLAQQTIALNLRVNENRFAHNDELNNYSGNADLLWNWRIGSTLSGQAGGDYTRALANFAETLYLGRDLVDATDYFGTARYQLGPHWGVYGGIREADTSHNALAAEINDSQNKSAHVGIEYATTVDDTIALEYRFNDGHFPEGDYFLDGVSFDRNYKQDTASVLLKYVITDKTVVNASAGYLKRDYTNEPIGAFSGDVWRVTAQWQPTDKTQISFAAWRELQAYLASESDYFVAKGGSISPVWAASEKFTLSMTVLEVDQDYISTSPSVLTVGTRHDRLNTQQVGVIYTPTRAILLNFSYSYQQRHSNQAQFTFDDRVATAAFTFKF